MKWRVTIWLPVGTEELVVEARSTAHALLLAGKESTKQLSEVLKVEVEPAVKPRRNRH